MAAPQGGGSTRAHLKESLRRRRTSQDSGVSRPSSYSSGLAPLSNAEGELRLAEIVGLIVNHEDAVSAHKDAVAAHKDAVATHRLAGHERMLVALQQEQAQLREFVKTASAGGQPTDTASETVENDAQDEGQILMVEL